MWYLLMINSWFKEVYGLHSIKAVSIVISVTHSTWLIHIITDGRKCFESCRLWWLTAARNPQTMFCIHDSFAAAVYWRVMTMAPISIKHQLVKQKPSRGHHPSSFLPPFRYRWSESWKRLLRLISQFKFRPALLSFWMRSSRPFIDDVSREHGRLKANADSASVDAHVVLSWHSTTLPPASSLIKCRWWIQLGFVWHSLHRRPSVHYSKNEMVFLSAFSEISSSIVYFIFLIIFPSHVDLKWTPIHFIYSLDDSQRQFRNTSHCHQLFTWFNKHIQSNEPNWVMAEMSNRQLSIPTVRRDAALTVER